MELLAKKAFPLTGTLALRDGVLRGKFMAAFAETLLLALESSFADGIPHILGGSPEKYVVRVNALRVVATMAGK